MPVSAPRLGKSLRASHLRIAAMSEQVQFEERPTAKRLILSVLSQPNMACLPIRQLIAWGALFDQKPSAIRVTVGRLVAEELLVKTGRGMYTIGPGGLALKNKAGEWATALTRICDWEGGWFGVYTAHLGKAYRRKVRARERAFRLLGFKELVSGLWVRPDNLHYTASQMYKKLCEFGLDAEAVVMRSQTLLQLSSKNPLTLWSSNGLNAGYEQATKLLRYSQQRLEHQDLHTVTRESFIVGEHVIRQINADPLLPGEHIDAARRDDMVKAMRRYSDFCHPYWAKFLGLPDAGPISSNGER